MEVPFHGHAEMPEAIMHISGSMYELSGFTSFNDEEGLCVHARSASCFLRSGVPCLHAAGDLCRTNGLSHRIGGFVFVRLLILFGGCKGGVFLLLTAPQPLR